MNFCEECGLSFPPKRAELGYRLCMACGEEHAKQARMGWTIAPMHKSNYMLITDRELLKQLNPKKR